MIAAKIKLNLGSRDRAIPGFIGIDCDKHDGVDIVGDISDLSAYADGSVSEIYASHCLEHFPHPKTNDVLREWCRVLEPGGILYVAVPDFKRVVEIYQKTGELGDWIQNLIWGDQVYKTAFHYAGFDEARLRKCVIDAGFSEASRVDLFPMRMNDCSSLISNIDGESVSLNMVVVK